MSAFDARVVGSIVATALKFREENGEVVIVVSPQDAPHLVQEAPGLDVVSEASCTPGEVHFLAREDYDRWGFSPWEEDDDQ